MQIFRASFSSVIQPSCQSSPLPIPLNSTYLGLEAHHHPKIPSLEDLPLPGGSIRAQACWCQRAAAQNPQNRHEVTNTGRVSSLAKHSAQQPRSFLSQLTSIPLVPQTPWLCHTTCTQHWLFPRSFSFHFSPLS